MTKFKQKLIKALSTFLLAGALLFPKAQAQERIIIDNFSQPNDTTLNYYGSGDVDTSNVVNWEDYNLMNSGTQNDMADINGDEVAPTTQDIQTLENYLNENINYLPSNWNKSNTAEKTSWFEKIIKIDKTDTIAPGTLCYYYAISFAINSHGFKSLEGVNPENSEWKFSKNGRFNIPVYYVNTRHITDKPHAINGVLIGDNPFDFNDWYFIEPQTDKKVEPGYNSMAKDNYVKINKLNINKDGNYSASPIIMWFLDKSGNPTLTYTKPYVVPSNPNKDTIPPEINLSISDSSYFNSSVNLEYLVKENQTFLDSAYYGLNGNKQDIDCELPYTSIISLPVDSISGTIPLASEEGEYDLVFFAKDIAKPQGNETIKNIKFFIDKTPPEINFIYPEANKEYVGSVDSMVVAVTDAHPSDTVNYTINGTDYSVAHSDTITVSTTSVEGKNNNYSITALDKAGNPSTAEVNFNIVPDAVEKPKTLEDYFKFYPNPVSNIGNFEFSLDKPQNLRFSVYDITGKQLEQKVFEGNLGENKVSHDFSKYSSQICIYRVEGDKGYVKTGKVFKK